MEKTLPPANEYPTSIRLNDEDKAAMKKAIAIIRKRSLSGLKLNPSNVFRIALHEFVKSEAQREQAQNKP